jgi:transmembrane sensor
MSERHLGKRAPAVFESFLEGRDAFLHPSDREEAAEFWNWLGEFERPGPAPVRQRPVWLGRAAAAALAVLTVSGGTMWMTRQYPVQETVQTVATGHAERRRIAFSDGSVVTLAADSRVQVSYLPKERRLRLTEGEALFKVAHDKSRPFVVETRHGEVVAVGTMFDVSVGKREAQVTVVEGVVRVALSEPGQAGSVAEPIEKLARKGERLSFGIMKGAGGNTGFIRQAADVDADNAIAWTRGRLVFQGEPLSEVIAEVNRYAKDRVVLTDPRAASVRVYGVVNQGDTAAVRDLIANPGAVTIEARDPERAR